MAASSVNLNPHRWQLTWFWLRTWKQPEFIASATGKTLSWIDAYRGNKHGIPSIYK